MSYTHEEQLEVDAVMSCQWKRITQADLYTQADKTANPVLAKHHRAKRWIVTEHYDPELLNLSPNPGRIIGKV